MRETLVDALRVELSPRGMSLTASCLPTGSWALFVDAPDPLGDVWIRVVAPDGTERRARVQGALDVVDERVFALTVASTFDEAPPVPDVPREEDGARSTAISDARAMSDPSTTSGAPTDSSQTRSAARGADVARTTEDAAASPSAPLDGEPVTSTRHLYGPVFSVGLGLTGALLPGQSGAVGGSFSFAGHFSPWFRLETVVRGAGWSEAGEVLLGLGFAGLIDLEEDNNWIEIGVGVVGSLEIGQRVGLGVGADLYVGFLQRLSDGVRLAVRAHVSPLYLVESEAADVSLAGELGLVFSP